MIQPSTLSLNISSTNSPRQHRKSIDLKESMVEESQIQKVNLEDSILPSSVQEGAEDSTIDKE